MTKLEFLDRINDILIGLNTAESDALGSLYDELMRSQWMPVEEELPPENGKTQQSINVWATNGLTSGEFRYNFDTKTWTNMWGDPFDITHWMPLPVPPQEEEE